MFQTEAGRYIGRIASVPGSDGFAFIGIGSVSREDGSPHGLDTMEDIFLHQDNCAAELKAGMEVLFDAVPDRKRGQGHYCAVGAVEYVEAELLPPDEEPIPGFAIMVPPARANAEITLSERLPVHAGMKLVPEETVSQVVANAPMPLISRVNVAPGDEISKEELARWFVATISPEMENCNIDGRLLDNLDAELDGEVEETAEEYRLIGLEQQIEVMRAKVREFKQKRRTLSSIFEFMYENKLVRRDTIIPTQYLPDLFMAVPVWYFWVNQGDQVDIDSDWNNNDPSPHPAVQHFCGLFSSREWYDTFQLFNRRVRTFKQYEGEMIPLHVVRRMRRAVELFNYVVIATPYHDQAGKDWEDIEWLRAIDPYVLGFKKGIPFFFVLSRFSDAGTFPLFNELVADTIEFLGAQKEKLNGFNQIDKPYWCDPNNYEGCGRNPFGNYLKQHVEQLLAAFKAGKLFDWLRGQGLAVTKAN